MPMNILVSWFIDGGPSTVEHPEHALIRAWPTVSYYASTLLLQTRISSWTCSQCWQWASCL